MNVSRSNALTLVLGGVRSGKSRYAQQIAAKSPRVTFIATARPSDPDMQARIERHRRDRPQGWRTLEVPLELDAAISSLSDAGRLAIIDCLTVYLANVMGKTGGDKTAIRRSIDRLCAALKQTKSSIVLVSNEVGSGVHPPTALGRQYCDLLGELNQRVAALADNVVLMVAGIPCTIKGQLPSPAPREFQFVHEVSEAQEQSRM